MLVSPSEPSKLLAATLLGFLATSWETALTNVFMPSLFLLVNTREPQSINAKLVLPIILIGIVAYTFTLLWDNLCRNSCILFKRYATHPFCEKNTLSYIYMSGFMKTVLTTESCGFFSFFSCLFL